MKKMSINYSKLITKKRNSLKCHRSCGGSKTPSTKQRNKRESLLNRYIKLSHAFFALVASDNLLPQKKKKKNALGTFFSPSPFVGKYSAQLPVPRKIYFNWKGERAGKGNCLHRLVKHLGSGKIDINQGERITKLG